MNISHEPGPVALWAKTQPIEVIEELRVKTLACYRAVKATEPDTAALLYRDAVDLEQELVRRKRLLEEDATSEALRSEDARLMRATLTAAVICGAILLIAYVILKITHSIP